VYVCAVVALDDRPFLVLDLPGEPGIPLGDLAPALRSEGHAPFKADARYFANALPADGEDVQRGCPRRGVGLRRGDHR